MGDLTNLGKKAEKKIREWLDRPEEGFDFQRIPDQISGFCGSQNICDFTLFKSPNYYYIESKATYNDNFPFSRGVAISDYQYDNMLRKSRIEGVTSYVAVLFASYQRAFLFNMQDIDNQIQSGGPKSVNIKKIDKWAIPYIEIQTLPSRKQLLDYNPDQAKEIF